MMAPVVVGTTLAAFVTDDPDTCLAWLYNAEQMVASHPDVRFFAALETDERGTAPFAQVIQWLEDLAGEWWTFTLDDGRTEVTTANRLRHIVCGQNLATDYACTVGASHLLFLAADLEPPGDCIPKLIEVDHPIVGGEVPTYCLNGPIVHTRPDGIPYPFPVAEHMATAAFVMLRRDLFRRLRWRWDLDMGDSDDPCLWKDARDLYGVPTYVRKDVVGRHHPECIPAIELRGHADMTVYR